MEKLRMERGKALNIGITNLKDVNTSFYIYMSPVDKQCSRFPTNALMRRDIEVGGENSINCFEF